mmetsp:Transcript_17069/g.41669  ORF Transcript_17069/g.41669 Transcript_17069/m.41669 type:complete len:209 (+) Transcript_17069:395-1021(+)
MSSSLSTRSLDSSSFMRRENMLEAMISVGGWCPFIFHIRSRSSEEMIFAPRIAPMRLSAPGPSSSTALAPRTKRSSPLTQRSVSSTCGRPLRRGALNSIWTCLYSRSCMGALDTPVARMTWSNSSRLTRTLPPSRMHTSLRSRAASVWTSSRSVVSARRQSSFMYDSGTDPPCTACFTKRARSSGRVLRNSKRRRFAWRKSSQSAAMS